MGGVWGVFGSVWGVFGADFGQSLKPKRLKCVFFSNQDGSFSVIMHCNAALPDDDEIDAAIAEQQYRDDLIDALVQERDQQAAEEYAFVLNLKKFSLIILWGSFAIDFTVRVLAFSILG